MPKILQKKLLHGKIMGDYISIKKMFFSGEQTDYIIAKYVKFAELIPYIVLLLI